MNVADLEVQTVRYYCRQMCHHLHSDPPMGLHGVVACVRTFGRNGVRDVIQNRRNVFLATVAVGAHQSHVLLKVMLPIVLLDTRGTLLPQLVCCGRHNVPGQNPSGHNEVARFDNGDFYTPGLHLVS